MTEYKKRAFFSKYGLNKEEETFYADIRNFIVESRKCQTLYTNCEGSYKRRVVNLKDKTTLENFVYYSLYFDGTNGWHNEQDFLKRQHVEEITDKIITISNSRNEIHFGLAWVYYFSYEDKTHNSVPVFKIYKSNLENEAVFLDTSLAVFDSWNSYLDHCREKLPNSFLCVPRNGDYRFLMGDKGKKKGLDLEFIKTVKKKNEEVNASTTARFKPFSQVAIRPWLNETVCFTTDEGRKIKAILSNLWHEVKKRKDKLFNVFVFGFMFYLDLKKQNISMVEGVKMMAIKSFMLLNTKLSENRFSESALTPAFLSSIFRNSTSDILTSSESQETLTDLQRDAIRLFDLLKNPKNNWLMILKIFCKIFIRGAEILQDLSLIQPLPPVLSGILLLLKACKHIQMFSISNVENGDKCSEKNKSQEFNSSNSSDLISSFLLNARQTENLAMSCRENDKGVLLRQQTLNDTYSTAQVISDMGLEKALSNLPLLETVSSDEAQMQLFKESTLELYEKPQRSTSTFDSSQFSTSFLFLGEKDNCGIYFIPNASLPQTTKVVRELIREPFVFKPEEKTVHNVVLIETCETVGTIFFPQNFTAIGFFSLEAVGEQIQTTSDFSEFPSLPDTNYFNKD